MKTLEEFDFGRNPKVSAQQIHELAKGDYIAKAEPIIFVGDSGAGKTHLLSGLAVAARVGPKLKIKTGPDRIVKIITRTFGGPEAASARKAGAGTENRAKCCRRFAPGNVSRCA
jgi:hypothetical protein